MADEWNVVSDLEKDTEVKSMVLCFLQKCPSECFGSKSGQRLQAADLEVHKFQKNYINYVIRVRLTSTPGVGFIIKMAPPYMPIPDVRISLPVQRGEVEHNAYQFFNSRVPGIAPEPVFYDETLPILCTRELSGCCALKEGLFSLQISLSRVQSFAASLASIHAATHVITLGDQGLEALRHQFPTLDPMVDMIRKFHFEKPFDRADPDRRCADDVAALLDDVLNDVTIMAAVEMARRSFVEDCECLIHGDLHIDSIVVSDGDLKMVDAEFARFGSCAYDMGLLIATWLMVSIRQRYSQTETPPPSALTTSSVPAPQNLAEPVGRDGRKQTWRQTDVFPVGSSKESLALCAALLEEYLLRLSQNLRQDARSTQNVLRRIVRFAGCELLAWTIGPPHFDFMDSSPRAQADCVRTAVKLLQNLDKITTVTDLFDNHLRQY